MIKKVARYFKSAVSNNSFRYILIAACILSTTLLTLDFLNFPSKILDQFGRRILIAILLCAGIIILICFIYSHVLYLLKAKHVNSADSLFIVSLATSIGLLITLIALHDISSYKIILCYSAIGISLILLIFRILFVSINIRKEMKESNVNELSQIYLDNIVHTEDLPLLVAEREVSYDLFDRQEIINHLYSSILASLNSSSSFVIGLEGEWGSGKTTIINNAKERIINNPEIIMIDDIDLWAFDSQESLLMAIFDAILFHSKIKYSVSVSKRTIREICSVITNNDLFGGVAKGLLYQENALRNIKKLKQEINEYLENKNLTIVFFIDNIDRASAENIIFLLKIIELIFDIKRFVYVLSYDRIRVNNILKATHEIDEHFLEKIVHQEIKVPDFNKDSLRSVYERCLSNVFKAYGNMNEHHEYDYIYSFIYKNVNDIRTFKRLINSAFSIALRNHDLYKPDLLTLEIVRFMNEEIYDIIKNNKEYFTCYDLRATDPMYFFVGKANKEVFNTNGEKLFDEISAIDKNNLLDLLSNVFPYVKQYLSKKPFLDLPKNEEFYKSVSVYSRACSAKFIDLYFSYGNNRFADISHEYNRFSDRIKNTNYPDKGDDIEIAIINMHGYYQKEFLEKLYLDIDSYSYEDKCVIIEALYNVILSIDDSSHFIELSAKARTIGIIARIFEQLGEGDQRVFLEKTADSYSKIGVLFEISTWLKDEKNKNIVKLTFDKMCFNVLDQSIDLYYGNHYSKYNIWGLYHYTKEKNKPDVFSGYVRKNSKPDYVYKMLLDAFSASISSNGYSYTIKEENLLLLFESRQVVDSMINNRAPQNENEEFIKKVYEKSKPLKSDNTDDGEVTLPYEMNLFLE